MKFDPYLRSNLSVIISDPYKLEFAKYIAMSNNFNQEGWTSRGIDRVGLGEG